LTTNKAFWPNTFNGDSTITAVLDSLLHHGHTVVIEGSSFRMNDRAESCRNTSLPHLKTLPDHLIIKPEIRSWIEHRLATGHVVVGLCRITTTHAPSPNDAKFL
jgi:IstB-like ATP binding protein